MRKKFVAFKNVLGHGDDKMIQVDRVSRNTVIAKDVSFQFAVDVLIESSYILNFVKHFKISIYII